MAGDNWGGDPWRPVCVNIILLYSCGDFLPRQHVAHVAFPPKKLVFLGENQGICGSLLPLLHNIEMTTLFHNLWIKQKFPGPKNLALKLFVYRSSQQFSRVQDSQFMGSEIFFQWGLQDKYEIPRTPSSSYLVTTWFLIYLVLSPCCSACNYLPAFKFQQASFCRNGVSTVL